MGGSSAGGGPELGGGVKVVEPRHIGGGERGDERFESGARHDRQFLRGRGELGGIDPERGAVFEGIAVGTEVGDVRRIGRGGGGQPGELGEVFVRRDALVGIERISLAGAGRFHFLPLLRAADEPGVLFFRGFPRRLDFLGADLLGRSGVKGGAVVGGGIDVGIVGGGERLVVLVIGAGAEGGQGAKSEGEA